MQQKTIFGIFRLKTFRTKADRRMAPGKAARPPVFSAGRAFRGRRAGLGQFPRFCGVCPGNRLRRACFSFGEIPGIGPSGGRLFAADESGSCIFPEKADKTGLFGSKKELFFRIFPRFWKGPGSNAAKRRMEKFICPFGAQEVDGCAACWKSRKIAGFPSKFVHYPKLARNV